MSSDENSEGKMEEANSDMPSKKDIAKNSIIERYVVRYKLKPLFATAILLLIVGIVGGVLTPTGINYMLSLSMAFFFYCIIPGYFLLLTLSLDNIERILMSIGISIATVPTVLYIANLVFELPISRLTTIFTITLCVIIGIILQESRIRSEQAEQKPKKVKVKDQSKIRKDSK